jgi:hypothetical protein
VQSTVLPPHLITFPWEPDPQLRAGRVLLSTRGFSSLHAPWTVTCQIQGSEQDSAEILGDIGVKTGPAAPGSLGLLGAEVLFAFWEADFHKMKGRETLSSSHNGLNTAEDNTVLPELLHIH